MEISAMFARLTRFIDGAGFYALLPVLFIALAPVSILAAEPVESVCIQCHSGLPDKYSQPVKLWRGSIHSENGVSCNDCHGGDPKDMAAAMSPERGFVGAPKDKGIPAFCGRCHVGVMKDYLANAHGKALGKGGPTCVTCHGNHQVAKASLDLINEKTCSRCHSFDRARDIKAAMLETEQSIVAIEARINVYKGKGVETDTLEKGLFGVRNRFHTLFHDVDVKRVKDESAGIRAELKKIDNVLQGLDDVHSRRKVAGAVAVAAALLAGLLFHLLRKTYEH